MWAFTVPCASPVPLGSLNTVSAPRSVSSPPQTGPGPSTSSCQPALLGHNFTSTSSAGQTLTQATPVSLLTPEGQAVSTSGISYNVNPLMGTTRLGMGSQGGLSKQLRGIQATGHPSLSPLLTQPLEIDFRHPHSYPDSPAVPSCGSSCQRPCFYSWDGSSWKPDQAQLSLFSVMSGQR